MLLLNDIASHVAFHETRQIRFYPSASSILFRHRGPKCRTAQMTDPLLNAQSPSMVKSQPLPMAPINGAPTTAPIQDRMFRQKLFTATPELDFFGMNSVSMVVAMANISMLPTP